MQKRVHQPVNVKLEKGYNIIARNTNWEHMEIMNFLIKKMSQNLLPMLTLFAGMPVITILAFMEDLHVK